MSDRPTPPGGDPEPPGQSDDAVGPERPPTGQQTPRADLRASDVERDGAVDALHKAVAEGRLSIDELEGRVQSAYTVATRRELELLIADVSVQPLADTRVGSAPATQDQLSVREGPGGSRWVVSILSGHTRRGRWRIGRRCTVVNVMGGSEVDLCDAELADRAIQLNVYSVMGGGEIRVPHGLDVQVSEVSVMGGNDLRLGDEPVPPGAPVLHLRLVSIMGGNSVRRGRKSERGERRQDSELPDAAPRRELGE
jgi:hypothetical protein